MTKLEVALATIAPHWISIPENFRQIDTLSPEKKAALTRLLQAEISGTTCSVERDAFVADLCAFDLPLNTIIGNILKQRVPFSLLADRSSSSMFMHDPARESDDLKRMNEKGYAISAQRLNPDLRQSALDAIKACDFANRGIFEVEFSGAELLKRISDGSINKYTGANGDTFWAKDLDQLAGQDFFRKLAFDSYFLSMAGAYLGCIPIHVQTNVWFSFPTFQEKNNLSTNAQMFHQDKEFAKFFKVFIYLTDVDENNGPHVFIEGSHIDEAHTLGVPVTDRISDADITKYYAKERIKTLVGPVGTITFADTSGVHKGMTVRSGHRIMLQLEYASSLYLSPVAPFSEPECMPPELEAYPEAVRARVMANYDNAARKEYLARMQRLARSSVGPLRRMLRLLKRHFMGALGGK